MSKKDFCSWGRTVIEKEIQALQQLALTIGPDFARACEILLKCEGRIIVTGIGKSGHIARKIAATLTSTGSPAYFLHPSEALHGDAGGITTKDCMIALSFSGESMEILLLLPVLKRMQVPLIGMTGHPQSSLARAATVNLIAPVTEEACPLNLAPTSSTTVSLVLGDALAIALLQARDFTVEKFALSHPGGMLGRRLLLTIDSVMRAGEELPWVYDHVPLKQAIMQMTQKKLGMTTVLNEKNELMGIITDGDLRRAFREDIDINVTQAKEVMCAKPRTVGPEMLAKDAMDLMRQHKITSLIVVGKPEQVIGVVHMHDLLQKGFV